MSVVSQNLRFDGQATKCAFLQPQRKSCGSQLSSEVPSSVATFRATIEQPTKAHTAFLRGLVGRILVRRMPDLPDLLLRPWYHLLDKIRHDQTNVEFRYTPSVGYKFVLSSHGGCTGSGVQICTLLAKREVYKCVYTHSRFSVIR